MNSFHPLRGFATLLLVALAACAPASTPAVQDGGQPPTPSLQPVNLTGPEMKVGSSVLYADGTVLVPVPAGNFTMGADGPDNPAHPVNLPDFWIYSTKVTNRQYAYCVAMGRCTPPTRTHNPAFDDPLRSNDPMVGVDHAQATAYCDFLHARLPTEAEWEKTARGPDAAIYPWGDAAPGCDLLNYGTCVGATTPVNNYPQGRSYYHAFQMEGNALEWVADWYQADYYLNAPTDDPQGPANGRDRVVRSSAFNSGGNQTQAFNRFHANPGTQRDNLGFRCVVEDPDYFAPFCNYPATYGTDGIGGAISGPQTVMDCPVISIKQTPTCQGSKPITIVDLELSFNKPLYSLTYQKPGSCLQHLPPSGLKFDCSEVSPGQGGGGQPIIFCSYCNVTLTSPPQCPENYTYDDSTKDCLKVTESSSENGACLPGFTPDAAGQCCTFDPPEVTDPAPDSDLICAYVPNTHIISCHPPFPSCPAGTSFDGQECTSTEHPKFCITELLEFASCTPGGGGGGGGGNTCNITESSCAATCAPLGYIYDAAACSCNCNAG